GNYVGFRLPGQGGPYTVRMTLPRTGGIFTNAEVTERGVTVGRVGPMTLTPGGVEVQLKINHGTKIPQDVHATVANLSAVGEQYVDLEPQVDLGSNPHLLGNGSTIPASATTIPLDD